MFKIIIFLTIFGAFCLLGIGYALSALGVFDEKISQKEKAEILEKINEINKRN